MTSSHTLTASESGAVFLSTSDILKRADSGKVQQATATAKRLDRNELIIRFQNAFEERKRLATHVLATGLVWQGVPPFAWHYPTLTAKADLTVEERYDLFNYDLLWLRRHHRQHAKNISYQRYKALLTEVSDSKVFAAVDYAFYSGKRPAWQIVKSMRLTDEQQRQCFWIRSHPVRTQLLAITVNQKRVFNVLQEAISKVRRTKTFTPEDALITLDRRRNLWVCKQLTDDGTATEIARKYCELTGVVIDRTIAHRQLKIIEDILRKEKATF
ncbi:hypothetical protein [Undibacterium flavidum]|uniref:Uncharacterized protein n=1 Tax=Undibacterium flavidum TaxID=2762297 RepID=A0ABR6YDL3_9BURK|nr:hypothetical protein [Undibacterium flavidum]MBC3874607.1 hypothetical protein [Undibacterium flavidum]